VIYFGEIEPGPVDYPRIVVVVHDEIAALAPGLVRAGPYELLEVAWRSLDSTTNLKSHPGDSGLVDRGSEHFLQILP
jgi:hypothetical protein